MLDRLSGFLLTLVILICVGLCFERFGFLLVSELRAIVSVIFGFATSCLLLSFIWLMQKKPIQNPWPIDSLSMEAPSMNPRGRQALIHDLNNVSPVRSVSNLVDNPPKYEDALINSKPLDWTVSKKASDSETKQTNKAIYICSKHPDKHLESDSSCSECRPSLGSISTDLPSDHKPPTRNSVAHLAINFVRGFTSSELPIQTAQQQDSRNETSRLELNENQNLRKPSFCQLDVNQIMISGSPPKYSDLVFNSLQNSNLSNDINEHTANKRGNC